MRVPFFEYVVLFRLLLGVSTTLSMRQNDIFSKMTGASCRTAIIVLNMTEPTLLSCVYKCQSTDDCTNVDYYPRSNICVGCTDLGALPDGSSDVEGWKRNDEKQIKTEGEKDKEDKMENNENKGSDVEQYGADCLDHVMRYNATDDGAYLIKTPQGHAYSVFCMNSIKKVGPGWTVFLRRLDDSVLFNRSFLEYINGFGSSKGNHWMGLQTLHDMTNGRNIDVIVLNGFYNERRKRVNYDDEIISNFTVGPPQGYRFSIGPIITLSAGVFGSKSCIRESNNSDFSTRDKDLTGSSCPSQQGYGGWWWNSECVGNPNGLYYGPGIERKDSTYCYTTVDGRVVPIKDLILAFRKSGVFPYEIEHSK